MLLLFSGSMAYAALSGNYTINSGAAPSASNYTTVTSAISDLVSGTRADGGPVNGPGVSGPVTLRIAAGTGPYTEQVTIGAIAGTSAANTVRLTGGPSMETITFGNTTTTDRHVIRLSGTNYVILDSLTLVNTGATWGYGVWVQNNSDYNVIRNCSITVDQTSTSSNFSGITFSGTSPTTNANNGDYNLIENNYISGGYYGISITGQSTTVHSLQNHLINNEIVNWYFYGVRHYANDEATIARNTLVQRSNGTTSGYGMYLYYFDRFLVERNNIQRSGTYGIIFGYGNYQGGSPTQRSTVRNNMIGGEWLSTGTTYGLYLTTNCRDIDVFNNSVSANTTSARALYIISGTGADIRNNSFSVGSSSAGYPAYVSATTYVTTMDYNNYHAANSTNFIYLGTAYSKANYVGAAGFNTNSRDGDPNYINELTNLHAFAAQLFDAGDPNVPVTDDFDGDVRPNVFSTIPDIGADEYMPDSLDVSPTALLDPFDFNCPDSLQMVRVVISNRGLNTVTGFTVGVNITGAYTGNVSTTYTGSLPLGGSDTVMVGTFNGWPGGTSNFSAYTALPGDQTTSNDTLLKTVQIASTPVAPPATNASICAGDSAQLVTASTGTTYWYDAPQSGNLVAAGDTLNTGPLAASTNYYVESRGTVTAGLTTTFQGGNACGGGNMFDITAISEVTIDSFDLNMSSSANVDIYYKVGTYVGSEGTAAAWTLLGSYFVTSAGVNQPSRCLIGGLTIPAGQTYGIFVSTTTIAYTTLSSAATYSSPEMTIYSGTGLCGLFSGFNFPRGWNGTVYYQAEGCPSQRTEVPVTVTPYPAVNLQDSSYCVSATLNAGTGTSYLWSNGDTTQTTMVTTSGPVSVTIANGACAASDTANITINALPVVNLGSDTTLCDGASLVLDAGNPGSTYAWSNSATGQTITVSAAGTYTATVTTAAGCTDSDNITIGTLNSPAGTASANSGGCPTIAFTGTSTGGAATTTGWDFGDGNTGTGLSPTHTYTANGQYTVVFTQVNDCGTSTETITVDINCILGIDDQSGGTVQLFPNPTQNLANLKLDLTASGPATITMTDLAGKVIFSQSGHMDAGSHSVQLDLSSMSAGVYVVRVASESFNWQGKLIRE